MSSSKSAAAPKQKNVVNDNGDLVSHVMDVLTGLSTDLSATLKKAIDLLQVKAIGASGRSSAGQSSAKANGSAKSPAEPSAKDKKRKTPSDNENATAFKPSRNFAMRLGSLFVTLIKLYLKEITKSKSMVNLPTSFNVMLFSLVWPLKSKTRHDKPLHSDEKSLFIRELTTEEIELFTKVVPQVDTKQSKLVFPSDDDLATHFNVNVAFFEGSTLTREEKKAFAKTIKTMLVEYNEKRIKGQTIHDVVRIIVNRREMEREKTEANGEAKSPSKSKSKTKASTSTSTSADKPKKSKQPEASYQEEETHEAEEETERPRKKRRIITDEEELPALENVGNDPAPSVPTVSSSVVSIADEKTHPDSSRDATSLDDPVRGAAVVRTGRRVAATGTSSVRSVDSSTNRSLTAPGSPTGTASQTMPHLPLAQSPVSTVPETQAPLSPSLLPEPTTANSAASRATTTSDEPLSIFEAIGIEGHTNGNDFGTL